MTDKSTIKLILVVGARPNFVKAAPLVEAIRMHNTDDSLQKINLLLLHTGQHYTDRMSKNFFEELGLPEPDINLGVGSGTLAEQIGKTMMEFEKIVMDFRPDWVVVVGDVNATLACSIVAKHERVKVCHVEAGLRSGDMSMPEEINRIVTDRLSDLLLTPDRFSITNLLDEGVPEKKTKFVGNIMIDTLEKNRNKACTLEINNILSTNISKTEKNKINIDPDKGKEINFFSSYPAQAFKCRQQKNPF